MQRPDQDAQALETVRKAAQDNPRYGYRRIAVVSGLGSGRSWRLWKQHGFQLRPQRTRKPRKKEKTPALPQQAEYPNHVWTYDLLFDRLAEGRPFKTLSVLDEFTREFLGILVATTIHVADVIAFLDGILHNRSAPVFLRSCDQYTVQGDLFSKAIPDDIPVPTPIEDAVANMVVIDALFQSAQTNT